MDFSIVALLGVADDASVWSNILSVIWRVVIVILGVNMLVIVHEFGHFIVARMCGVRCDKFYIWFDAYGFKLFSFKKGNTEYGLGWLPLGGYVKMLGQEDNPGGIQAEIDRAKLERTEKQDELSEEEKHEQDAKIKELENQLYAPDSYLAKNVFQRMAIISAGVVMNIIFAIVCATLAAVVGTPETSAKIGYVAPGSPAWTAGFQPGDEILAIGDDHDPIFSSILVACMDGKELSFDVVRPGYKEPLNLKVTPKVEEGGLTPMIGVGPVASTDLAEVDDNKPYGLILSKENYRQLHETLSVLKGGERVVSMNGVPVASTSDYRRLSRLYIDRPIEFVFAPTVAKRGKPREIDETKETKTVTLPPTKAPDVGVRLTMGEIVAIQPGSVAESVGLISQEVDENGTITRHGDVLLDINNEPILDPVTLPYKIFDLSGKETLRVEADHKTTAQRSIVLTILRDGERVDVPVSLPSCAPYYGFSNNRGRMAIGSLGLAYEVKPYVAGIDGTVSVDASPLGGKITEITTLLPDLGSDVSDSLKEDYKSITGKKVGSGRVAEVTCSAKNSDSEIITWFSSTLPLLPDGTEVSMKVTSLKGDVVEVRSKVKRDGDAYLVERGLLFGVDAVYRRAETFGAALSFGVEKTVDSASQVFVFLRNVGKNVSAKALGGPGMIVGTAYQAAGRNDGVFLLFLCLISANLAVVNFLPIPVLDGGHMVFLLYEMITRRKPNEKVQIALSYVGLALILALMFWVIFLDIVRYCFN